MISDCCSRYMLFWLLPRALGRGRDYLACHFAVVAKPWDYFGLNLAVSRRRFGEWIEGPEDWRLVREQSA